MFFKLSSEYLHLIYLINAFPFLETCYVIAYMSRIYHMKKNFIIFMHKNFFNLAF